MNLICLTDLHTNAVLKIIRSGELRIFFVIMMTLKGLLHECNEGRRSKLEMEHHKQTVQRRLIGPEGTHAETSRTFSSKINLTGTLAILVKLSDGVMLSAQMPVNVHGAKTSLPVGISDGCDINRHLSLESLGDI